MSLYLQRHMDHFDEILGRLELRKQRKHTFDFDVTVELYPGVKLEGHIECAIAVDRVISDHELTVKDMHGMSCQVDWDDLLPNVQDKIETQVISRFNEWSLGS